MNINRQTFQSDFENALVNRIGMLEDASDNHSSNQAVFVPISDSPASSFLEPSANFDVAETRRALIKTEGGNFFVIGNSVLTECPECQAPMTIRSWLNLADCWRCETSTRLTRQQIEMLEEFTKENTSTQPDADPPISQVIQPQPGNPTPAVVNSSEPVADVIAEFDRLTKESVAGGILRRGFSGIPAWLISFLLHLLLILLLALFFFTTTTELPSITLSTFVSPDRMQGGEIRIENPEHSLVDDLRMANDMDVSEEEIRDVLEKAKSEAEQLLRDDSPLAPQPDLDEVKKNVTTSRDQLMSFAARDPRVRTEIIHKEGGTSFTEAAVARGLRWLASVQNKDGSWSLTEYDDHARASNHGDAAATSLALLPFLGAGQTHERGVYRENVAKGLKWLIDRQKENGDLRINFSGQAGMYAHGQATIVLCEALAITGDQRFKKPAQLAIDFIESAQHRNGGWRYRPGQEGDTSMLGWQLMALQSARAGNTGINVDDSTLKLADYFLDQASYRGRSSNRAIRSMPTGSLYTYRAGQGNPTASMTAEALLCRMYLGWERDDPRVIEAIRWLIEHNMPSNRNKNIYYWYYATQVMHHFGGEVWEVWNRRMREILVAGQTKKGSRAGSWNPKGYEWGSKGGRIYVTSLSICTLEVYYRHLPIFKQIELDARSTVSAPVRSK